MATAKTFTLSPSMLFENGKTGVLTTAGSVSYYKVGNGARWKWTTSARKMTVSCYCEYSSVLSNNGRLALIVNGVKYFFGAYQGTANAVYSTTMRLPAGALKTVELLVPLQYAASAGGAPLGIYPFSVQFDEDATEISPTLQASHLVIYGDSIASGGIAISPAVYGYAGLLKNGLLSNTSVTLVSHGFRRLADDCSTGGAATAFVTAMLALLPTKILITIGSNDQALAPLVTLANFTTYYGRLLDEIHTQAPTMPIVCLSPIRRSTEGDNANGDALADFRSAISTLVSARSGWTPAPTYEDGLAIFDDLTEIPDDTHPGTAGHVTMATAIAGMV